MATTQIATGRAANRSGALPVVGATVIGLAAAALAAVGADDREVAVATAAALTVAAWVVLTVFLAARRPQERLWDYPAGEMRLVQKAVGYEHTFVNGVETFTDGECTNETPGRLLRNGTD